MIHGKTDKERDKTKEEEKRMKKKQTKIQQQTPSPHTQKRQFNVVVFIKKNERINARKKET